MKFRTFALPAMLLFLPAMAYTLPSGGGPSNIAKSNNIILMEGDLIGPVKAFRQYVIGPESERYVRDVNVDFDQHGQIISAVQSYGPNPVWESQLHPDNIVAGWVSRSAVAVKTRDGTKVTQFVSAYKTDKAGRIVKVSNVEAQPGAISVTNRYYFYTPDQRVRFYLSLGGRPGFGLYLYEKDGRLTKVIKNDNVSYSTFTQDGKDLSTTTKTPYITYSSLCQQWDPGGNCTLVEKQEKLYFRGNGGEEKTQVTTLWQRQNISYYPGGYREKGPMPEKEKQK